MNQSDFNDVIPSYARWITGLSLTR